MSSKIFIITGTSGAGKDSVIGKLKEKGFEFEWVVTTTSRPMRKGEVEGKSYYFVTPEEFRKKIEKDEMVEYATVYGNYYGAEKKEIEKRISIKKPVIWKVDIQGIPVIKEKYPDSLCIFISTPNFSVLEKRIRERGVDDEEVIKKRMEVAKFEMEDSATNPLYDHVIVNEENRLDETAEKVIEIIKSSYKRKAGSVCI